MSLMTCSHVGVFWVEGLHPDPAADPLHDGNKRMSSMGEAA